MLWYIIGLKRWFADYLFSFVKKSLDLFILFVILSKCSCSEYTGAPASVPFLLSGFVHSIFLFAFLFAFVILQAILYFITLQKMTQENQSIETKNASKPKKLTLKEMQNKKPWRKKVSASEKKKRAAEKRKNSSSSDFWDAIKKKAALDERKKTLEAKRKEELAKKYSAETEATRCLVDEYMLWLKKMKKFEKYTENHIRFGVFLAIPECREFKLVEYVARHKTLAQTLSERKFRDDVQDVRDYMMKAYFKSKTSQVLTNLVKGATTMSFGKVDAAAIKLFLQYVEWYTEKTANEVDLKWTIAVQFANVGSSPFMKWETPDSTVQESEEWIDSDDAVNE